MNKLINKSLIGSGILAKEIKEKGSSCLFDFAQIFSGRTIYILDFIDIVVTSMY